MSRTTERGETDRFRRWWPVAVAAAAVINLIQFPIIEGSASKWYKAIPPYETGDVRAIARAHMPTVKRDYGLEFTLARWGFGATLTVFPGSGLSGKKDLYVAFDEIEVANYESTLPESVAATLDDHVVAIGVDKDLGEYWIAVGPDREVDNFVLFINGDNPTFVDRNLLPDGFAGEPA